MSLDGRLQVARLPVVHLQVVHLWADHRRVAYLPEGRLQVVCHLHTGPRGKRIRTCIHQGRPLRIGIMHRQLPGGGHLRRITCSGLRTIR